LSGGIAATRGFGVAWQSYLGLQLVEMNDVILGLSKAVAFGIAVPLVACQAGLGARGGAPGVGQATTFAVIAGSIWVLLLDFVIGTIGHLAAGGLW
ncbi:MAG: ABC transporter permease, partial [Myxococcota bacterium]